MGEIEYAAFESKKEEMTLQSCISLIMYFEYNPKTQDLLQVLELLPNELKETNSLDVNTNR